MHEIRITVDADSYSHTTIRANPGGLTLFQITIDVATTRRRTETRTGIKHLEPLDIAAVPPTLVGDEAGKHTPAAIGDAFC